MKDSTYSHPASTVFGPDQQGHHEYPYPYNAWVTHIFSLADFAKAFAEHMQFQRVRLPKDLWSQEKEVNHTLLSELVRSYELPASIAAELWRPYSDRPQAPSEPIQQHTPVPPSVPKAKAQPQAKAQPPKNKPRIDPSELSRPEIPPQPQIHPKRRTHDQSQVKRTEPIIDASFSASEGYTPIDIASHQREKPRKRGALTFFLIGILLINGGIGLSLLYPNAFKNLPSLTENDPRQILQDIFASDPTAPNNPVLAESPIAPPSMAKVSDVQTAPNQDGISAIIAARLQETAKQKSTTATLTSNTEPTNPPSAEATSPPTGENKPILMELMRQASELNIEPYTDRDTALFYLNQLKQGNANHDTLSRAHFSLQRGYEALGTLAIARSNDIEAQQYRSRAQNHALIALELQE